MAWHQTRGNHYLSQWCQGSLTNMCITRSCWVNQCCVITQRYPDMKWCAFVVQDCSNSIANTLELLQSYTKPLSWHTSDAVGQQYDFQYDLDHVQRNQGDQRHTREHHIEGHCMNLEYMDVAKAQHIVHQIGRMMVHIDGLVQERCNSSVLAMELRLSCTNPPTYF